jgi:hypothetical protein
MDAPAFQHSMEDWTISSGVYGMCGATSRVIRLPVMAAVMINLSIGATPQFLIAFQRKKSVA